MKDQIKMEDKKILELFLAKAGIQNKRYFHVHVDKHKVICQSNGNKNHQQIWEEIAEELNKVNPVWELFSGHNGMWGDGSVFGMSRLLK